MAGQKRGVTLGGLPQVHGPPHHPTPTTLGSRHCAEYLVSQYAIHPPITHFTEEKLSPGKQSGTTSGTGLVNGGAGL